MVRLKPTKVKPETTNEPRLRCQVNVTQIQYDEESPVRKC